MQWYRFSMFWRYGDGLLPFPAQGSGLAASRRPYHDTVFRRFWSHELEIEELSDISGVIASIGGSAGEFEAYVNGPCAPGA